VSVAVDRRWSVKAFGRALRAAAASARSKRPARHLGLLETVRIERTLVIVFLAIRTVHVGQGLLDAGVGFHSYARPAWAAALAALCVVETSWLAQRLWRRGRLDPLAVRVDVVFGVIGLFAIGAALKGGDRTASLNWMLGYTVGTTVAAGLGLRVREGVAAVFVLAGAYAGSVWPNIEAGGGSTTTALSNVMSYFGFYVVAAAAIAIVRRMGRELQAARDAAVEQGRLFATEQERTRQHRLLHDSALQTLEAIARGWGTGDDALVSRARMEAVRLRHALRGAPEELSESDVASALAAVAAEIEPLGLRTELVTAELEQGAAPEVAAAVCDAVREALTNVIKHGHVQRAVVRAVVVDGVLQVTIRDSGAGFSPGDGAGFGLAHSIHGRIAEVGGRATVNSSPGLGTKVTLRVPL
jgi:signal transduction histidine kinase